jgi:hypothetical protein
MDHLSTRFFTILAGTFAGGRHRPGSKAGLLQSGTHGRNRLIQSPLCFFVFFL